MIGSHWFAYNIQTYKGFICEVNNPAGLSVFWNFGMTQFATGKCWCFDDGQFYAVELAVVLSVSCLMEEIGVSLSSPVSPRLPLKMDLLLQTPD